MSDTRRGRVIWFANEAAAIAAVVAVGVWALQEVDQEDAEAIVTAQIVERSGAQRGEPTADAGAGDENVESLAGGVWPAVVRSEPVQAKETPKAIVLPPLELLGILTSREGRPVGVMMYDGRTDETMVLEIGGERAGVRVLAIEASGVRLALEGAEFDIELARGS